MAIKRTFKIIQLIVDDIKELEQKEKLLHLFADLEIARDLEVKTARAADRAFRDAQVIGSEALAASAKSVKLQTEFLEQAAGVFPLVAQELQWMPFRNETGQVVLESIFTRRDQRNMMRAEKAHMEAVASGSGDLTRFFETEDDNETEERHVGFGSPAGKKKDAPTE
jgi:hypothetical protein